MRNHAIATAVAAAGLVGVSGFLPAEAAPSAPRASVTVTITAEGTDMSGVVKSSRPALCAAERTVKVFKLVDGEPHLWATDTTDEASPGAVYEWSTGNTGTPGRFYAKVAPKPGCQGDVSPTIRVRRSS